MKKISLQFLLLAALLFVGKFAHAATLSFDPQNAVVSTTGSFSISLNITADNPVNAISLVLPISQGLEVTDVSDGNSVINYWVDKPAFDPKTRILSFSGIIPGGFSGKDGRLLVVKMKADREGSFALNYDKQTSKIYLNTPDAELDTLMSSSLNFQAVAGKQNTDTTPADTTPPEDFSVDIIQNSTSFGNRWVAVFGTQDKGTGIAGYEAAENWRNVSDTSKLSWKSTDSPYILQDQARKSYLYIRATDKAGNARVVIVAPLHPVPWYGHYLGYIITGILVVLAALFIILRKRNRRSKLKSNVV